MKPEESDRQVHKLTEKLKQSEQKCAELIKENAATKPPEELRHETAAQRIRINKLEHELMRAQDRYTLDTNGLKRDLQHAGELRRELENQLRRATNSTDLTYTGPTRSSANRPSAAATGTSNYATASSLDPTSCGVVGSMLLARSETEIAALKGKNAELEKQLEKFKRRIQLLTNENTELKTRPTLEPAQSPPRNILLSRQEPTADAASVVSSHESENTNSSSQQPQCPQQ